VPERSDIRTTVRDLTREKPRPMDARSGGYVWLPRMTDKARASRAGTLGDYLYPCPIDRACLGRLGIDATAFADIAEQSPDDAAVLASLEGYGVAPPDAGFDPVALEEELNRP
jgi:Domain of unknown function (DUF5069)